MPRRQKLYHYIYRTTCLVTGKFYVGMHSTDDLDDGYLGSGKILGYSRRKHGDENHKREILELLPTREALKLRETEIVNEQLLADPLNINLKYGGDGGGFLAEKNKVNDFHRKGQAAALEKMRDNLSAMRKRQWLNPSVALQATKRNLDCGRKLGVATARSVDSIARRKNTFARIGHQQGVKNSMNGKRWMTNGIVSKPVLIQQMTTYFENGWKLGRKLT